MPSGMIFIPTSRASKACGILLPFLQPVGGHCVHIQVARGRMYHIGVGSNVVCSTLIGNARASMRGMDNRTVHAFFYVLM